MVRVLRIPGLRLLVEDLMAGIKKPAKNSKPVPCKGCGADVWNPYVGSCDDCLKAAYDNFLKAMGWDDEVQVQDP